MSQNIEGEPEPGLPQESPWQTEIRESNQTETASQPQRRLVRYGDPEYYQFLPSQLHELLDYPFGYGSFGFYPPPYEVDVDFDGLGNEHDSQ